MPIVSFDFSKISAERKINTSGKIDIRSNITILDIEKEKLELAKNEEALKFLFEFKITYEPDAGEIDLKGHTIFIDDEKKIKDILKEWKNKKIPEEVALQVINNILYRCNLKALQMAHEISLPLHIQMPRATPARKDVKEYIG